MGLDNYFKLIVSRLVQLRTEKMDFFKMPILRRFLTLKMTCFGNFTGHFVIQSLKGLVNYFIQALWDRKIFE